MAAETNASGRPKWPQDNTRQNFAVSGFCPSIVRSDNYNVALVTDRSGDGMLPSAFLSQVETARATIEENATISGS